MLPSSQADHCNSYEAVKIVVKGGHIVGIFGMYAEDIQLGVGSSAHIVIQELSIDLIAQYSL